MQATMIRPGMKVKLAPHRGYHEVLDARRGGLVVEFLFNPNPVIPETVMVPLTAAVPVHRSSLPRTSCR